MDPNDPEGYDNDTNYTNEPDCGVNCHLIFSIKRKSDGTIERFKARLVADGSTQRFGLDFDRVFSTVVKASTLRMVLAIAARLDLDLTQLDIRQAYLQAKLDRDIYMRVPPGLPRNDSTGALFFKSITRSAFFSRGTGGSTVESDTVPRLITVRFVNGRGVGLQSD